MIKKSPIKSPSKRLYVVKKSAVHGRGVFAKRDINKGEQIIEYLGERISWEEANRRYVESENHSHTVFFSVDEDTVLDGAVNGNAARYINHSCNPNCKAKNVDGRIFIYAKVAIAENQELFYDYKLEIDPDITEEYLLKYKCFCGSPKCRGTQLDLKSFSKKKKEEKKKPKSKKEEKKIKSKKKKSKK